MSDEAGDINLTAINTFIICKDMGLDKGVNEEMNSWSEVS